MNESAVPGTPNRARNITRGIGSLTIQNLVTSALAFVFLGSLLRLLSPAQFGAYSAVLTSVGVAGAFSTFGLQSASVRYTALFTEFKEQDRIRETSRAILVLTLVFSGITSLVFFIASPFLSLFFMKTYDYTWLFFLGGLWLFSISVASVLQGFIQGLKRYVLLAKILLFSRAVMVVFTIVALFAFHSVGVAIAAWILYSALIITWSMKTIGSGLLKRKANQGTYGDVFKYSFPIGIASVLSVIASSSDTVVVGGYLNLVFLGIYTAAVTISSVLTVIFLTPISTALFPEASSSSQNEAEVSNVLRLSIRFVVLAALPASLIVAAVSSQLLSLFSGGGGYLSGAIALELIAIFYFFPAINTIVIYFLQAVGRSMQVLVIGLVTAGADVGLSVLLVPHFGLMGAALSKVGMGAAGMIVALALARSYLKVTNSFMFYLKGIVASIIPFAVVLALSVYFSDKVITLVPYAAIGGLVYLLCIKVFKILSEEDRRFLSHILPGSLNRILQYI